MTSPIINMVTMSAEQFQAIASDIHAMRKAVDTMVAEEIFRQKEAAAFLKVFVDTLKRWDDENVSRFSMIGGNNVQQVRLARHVGCVCEPQARLGLL